MDAWPMIAHCMILQGKDGYPGEYHSYPACVICKHEVSRHDDFLTIFVCGWCNLEPAAAEWLTPRRVDGKIKVIDGGRVEPMYYADA